MINETSRFGNPENGDTQAAKPNFTFVTAKELDESDCKVEYHIKGWLAKRQPCILAGPKKVLKTSIVIDLCTSLAAHNPFLGNFHTEERTPTLLMSGESGRGTIQETYRRICLTKGLAANQVRDLHFTFRVPQVTNVAHMVEIRDFVIERDIKVIVIDPAYLALSTLGNDASNMFSVGSHLQRLTELCEETGVTPILVHHTTKASLSYDNPPELEDIAWAGFDVWVRQWILIGRREKFNTENPGSHKLWATVGGSAGHSTGWALNIEEGSIDDDSGRRWDTDVINIPKARQEDAQIYARRKADAETAKKDTTLFGRPPLGQ